MQAQERASSGAWLCGGDGTRIKPWGIWELFDHADATGHAMHTEDAQLCATKRDSRDDGGTSAHVRDAPKLTSQGEPSTQPRALARKRDPHHRTKARDGLPGLRRVLQYLVLVVARGRKVMSACARSIFGFP